MTYTTHNPADHEIPSEDRMFYIGMVAASVLSLAIAVLAPELF
jgi:hypothetical protein